MKDILDEIDHLAEMAGARHQVFVEAILSTRQRAMTGPHAFTAKDVRQLRLDLLEIGDTHIWAEDEIADDIFETLTGRALERAQSDLGLSDAKQIEGALSDALSDAQSASTTYLSGEIVSQINRDANQVLKSYRNSALRVLTLADSRGISRDDAAMTVMMDEMGMNRKVWFMDSLGRRLSSRKYIRRLWRMVLRDHWVQVYVTALQAYGERRAYLWHPDVQHRSHGMILDLDEADFGLEDYESIMHPNARVLPIAERVMEKTE